MNNVIGSLPLNGQSMLSIHRLVYAFAVTCLICVVSLGDVSAQFVHPGLLHTQQDLARMREAVAQQRGPIYQAFIQFAESMHSDANYRLRGPFNEWGRKPNRHTDEAENDATAAYQNALMWAITGKQENARKSIEIINAWQSKLKKVSGIDGVLASGLQGFKFANAAEILRYTDSGWSHEDAVQCEQWFMNVWHPTIENYAHFANGNWEGAALQTKMAIAVFCNDRNLFEETIRYAVSGAGNGSILHTVVYPTGQGQESTRKQGYAQLGLALLSCAAEVAWNQGVDLYGWRDNRILKGFEYVAAYGLGHDVPYQPYLDRTGKYGFGGRHQHYNAISADGRGGFRPVLEQPFNHYVSRRGLNAPFLTEITLENRPEGRGRDHCGHGTLTHWRPPHQASHPQRPPHRPAGLVARSKHDVVRLNWVQSVEPLSCTDATHYIVHRADTLGGDLQMIASNVPHPIYEDKTAKRGTVYYYAVTSVNQIGASQPSVALAVSHMPEQWSSQDIGSVGVEGFADFNGQQYSLEGEGANVGGTSDELHFAFTTIRGNGTITARVVQPVSSQWSKPGVMMRQSLHPKSVQASVLLLPPQWSGGLVLRLATGESAKEVGRTRLREPHVANGNRLMTPYWVKLTRKDDTVTGLISADGHTWQELGSEQVRMNETIYVGLVACSQLEGVSTTVTYDNVVINTEER